MSSEKLSKFTFIEAFKENAEYRRYGQNALTVFVMQLYLRLENLDSFVADAITDGGDDKKIDLCFIDINAGRAIIGQSYLSNNWGKEAASANKASDINTGIAWLLSADIDKVPVALKPKAQELRSGIQSGEIQKIEIVFIHNAFSSKNVENELTAAVNVASDLAERLANENKVARSVISSREFGLTEIEELYKSFDSDIIIDEWIELPVTSWISEKGNTWNALVTSIPAEWIRSMSLKHGNDLVSANFRNYLGSRASKGNINNQIKQTIVSEPENFWVFNNGITALTHEIDDKKENKLRVRGLSIINGAQTSGALSESEEQRATDANVLFRIVASNKKSIIDKIIRFNNTQNRIVSADQRSNEPVLKRLESEFRNYNISFVIRRSHGRNPPNSIISSDIARVLAAFHGRPQLGYRNPSTVFDDESFNLVYSNEISVEHIFMVSELAKAYDNVKSDLKSKIAENNATQVEESMYEVLKFTSSRYFIVYIVGFIGEQIIGKRIADLHSWRAKEKEITTNKDKVEQAWIGVLKTILPFTQNLVAKKGDNAMFEVPRSGPLSEEVAKELQALIQALEATLSNSFEKIRNLTKVN